MRGLASLAAGLGLASLGLASLLLAGCARETPAGPHGDPEAVETVRAMREAHGSRLLDDATFRFAFRGDTWEASRDGGHFRYARTSRDSLGRETVDALDNEGVSRTVEGQPVRLAPGEAAALHTALNSVVYFATLPYALTDPAVRVRSLGPDSVEGSRYDRVEVTFAQDGGGRDWDDRYLYWVHPERRTLDYLAYTYRLAPGASGPNDTGHRFRRVTGVSSAGGLRVQDYQNLTADSLSSLDDYPRALAEGRTRRVSDVQTERASLHR